MNTSLYSIVFASLRKVTQEKVSLGLILSDGETVFCKFSRSKLNALKNLVEKEEFKLIQESIAAIEFRIKLTGESVRFNYHELYKVHESAFALDYINYLSRYKNNLVTYSEPKPIDIETTEQNALKLFSTYVGLEREMEISVELAFEPKITLADNFNMKFASQIKKHFIVGHTVSSKEVPNLLVPVKIDFIGKNGVDVFVHSVDMTSGPAHISKEITSFYYLKDTYKKNRKPIQDFLLTQEPPKKMKKQHILWSQLRESGQFNNVDISESEKIIDYAEQYDVKPMFGDIDNTNYIDDSRF